jgi:DNA-binding transcriptional regulator YiaG
MMSSFGDDLIAAMSEAAAHAQGVGQMARTHTIEVPDVRAIREELGLSQQAFASAYRSLSRRSRAGSKGGGSQMLPPAPISR